MIPVFQKQKYVNWRENNKKLVRCRGGSVNRPSEKAL
jgi:hypothetical protein